MLKQIIEKSMAKTSQGECSNLQVHIKLRGYVIYSMQWVLKYKKHKCPSNCYYINSVYDKTWPTSAHACITFDPDATLPVNDIFEMSGWLLSSWPVLAPPSTQSTPPGLAKLVSWSLTSLFSTNMAISKTKGQGWKVIHTQWRKASDILTSTLAAFLFSSHPKKGKGSRGSFKLLC